MVKISIIVIIYNIEKYLTQCIDSILSQTFNDYELILVDDGSIDNCSLICDEYSKKDKRVKVIHQKNQGSVSARWNGILASSGKYISLIDGDDWIDCDFYEKLYKHIINEKIDIVVTGYKEYQDGEYHYKKVNLESGLYEGSCVTYVQNKALYNDKFYEPGINPALWNKIIKRTLFFKDFTRADSYIKMGDDAAVLYPMIARSDSIVIDNTIQSYNYRIVSTSMSRSFDNSFLKRSIVLFSSLMNNLKTNKQMQSSVYIYSLFILEFGITRTFSFSCGSVFSLFKKYLMLSSVYKDHKKLFLNVKKDTFNSSNLHKWMKLFINGQILLCIAFLCLTKFSNKICTKKRKIVVYDPEVIFWGVATGFHGYSVEFIKKYADCIYLNKPIIDRLRYRRQLLRLGIKRYIPFVNNLNKFSKRDFLVGFVVPIRDDENLAYFKGKKIFHLMDYYLFVSRNRSFLNKYSVDYVIGHTLMDHYCPFFLKYYPEYMGKVISLPFGFQKRFKYLKKFENRKNIAVGLGAINPINDPLISEKDKTEYIQFFSDYEYSHPGRKFIQDHYEYFSNTIEALFPSKEKQKDFSYDAVECLNNYSMFFNDAGLSNFPPARTYEGIACGGVMVAEYNDIYYELGFIPNINYIAYKKGDYLQLNNKIKYFQAHSEELKKIQERSLKLAKLYSHSHVADILYKKIISKGCK